MDISAKLQVKPGATVAALGLPDDVVLPLADAGSAARDAMSATAVIAFVTHASDIDRIAGPALDAAREDRLAWIAYPKAGGLGTDLYRDSLASLCRERGTRPVRQIAIDDVWSALQFRPAG